jgi:hypothetical protein
MSIIALGEKSRYRVCRRDGVSQGPNQSEDFFFERLLVELAEDSEEVDTLESPFGDVAPDCFSEEPAVDEVSDLVDSDDDDDVDSPLEDLLSAAADFL